MSTRMGAKALAKKAKALAKLTLQQTTSHEPSYSIEAFCLAENMSRPFYAEMRKKGCGPAEYRVPGTNFIRITYAARLAWHARLQSGEFAEVIAAKKLAMLAHARKATKASIASPNHISNVRAARKRAQASA